MQEFEKLAEGFYLEGLSVAGGDVWFSDVIGGGVHRLRPDGSITSFLEDRRWIGGILATRGTGVLSTGKGGIMRLDPDSGKFGWLLGEIGGQPVNGINELVGDGQGGLYFGTVDLDSIIAGKKPGPVALYRRAANGEVSLQCGGLGFSNGMAISSDGKTLFCNESFDGTYAHDIDPHGNLSNRRLFLRKRDCDGMVIDAAGIVWITGFASSHIERISPDGRVLERFETPAQAITQARFGGTDGRDLYLTTVPLDAGAGLATGHLPVEKRSQLLKTRIAPPLADH